MAPDAADSRPSSTETKTRFISVPLTPRAAQRLPLTDQGLRKFLLRACVWSPQPSTFPMTLWDGREQLVAGTALVGSHSSRSFSRRQTQSSPCSLHHPLSETPYVAKMSLRDTPQWVPHCLQLPTPQKGFSSFIGHYFNILLF